MVNVEYPLDDSLVSGNTEVNMTEATSLRDACDQCQKARLKSHKSTSVTEVLPNVFCHSIIEMTHGFKTNKDY